MLVLFSSSIQIHRLFIFWGQMRMLVNDAGAAEAAAAAAAAAAAGDEAGAETVNRDWEDRWDEPGAWDAVMKDLRRIKWADERVYELMLER